MKPRLLCLMFLFCLLLPTASLALSTSNIIEAYGRSAAEFEENIKRMTGDTLEGQGMVLNVYKSGLSSVWNVHISAYNKNDFGFVIIIPVNSPGIPFRWKNDVAFSGRIKSVVIRALNDGGKYFEVKLSGSVTLIGEVSVWQPPMRNAVEQSVGSVEVTGHPKGARVYLDESFVGRLPCLLEKVDPGVHDVRVEYEGFHGQQRKAEVLVGHRTMVKVDLSPVSVVFSEPRPMPPIEAAKIYKWRDETGQLHVSDKPPPHLLNKDVAP